VKFEGILFRERRFFSLSQILCKYVPVMAIEVNFQNGGSRRFEFCRSEI